MPESTRSVNVKLSASAQDFIQGTQKAADSLKGLAREALAVRTAMGHITPEVNQLQRAVRGLSVPATAVRDIRGIGTALRDVTPHVARLNAALRGLNVPASAIRDIRALGTAFNGQLTHVNALIAAMRGIGLPPGGLAGNDVMRRQIQDLEDQIRRMRAAAGAPIPVGPIRDPAGAGAAGAAAGRSGSVFGGSFAGNLASNAISNGLSQLASGFKDTVKATADFETSINTLGAVSQTTGPQLDVVAKKALALGADASIAGANASDAAVAMTELVKGGLSVADAMTAAKGTLQLASAGSVDFTTAAQIQTSAMAAFSLQAGDAAKVADTLANTANAARGDISDFATGLTYSGATAHLLGWNLEQTTAVLGLFAKNGLTGSVGGATLNTMLLNMLHNSKPATAAMKELGLKVYDSNHHFISAAALTDQLAKAQKNMTPEAFNSAIAILGGNRAVRGLADVAKEGSAGLQDMTDKIHNGAGAAAFSEAKMKGLGGSFANFKNQVETAQVVLGEKFSPALQTALGGLADFVPKLTSFLTGGSIGGGLSSIGKWFTPLIDGAKALVSTAWPYVQKFGQQLGQVWDGIVAGVKPVVDAIGNLFKSAAADGTVSSLGKTLTGFGTGMQTVAGWLKPVGEAIADVVNWFSRLPAPVKYAAAALVIMKFAAGPLVGIFKAVRQSVVMATYGMGALGFAGRSVGASMALVGNSIKTAFGGWIGLGITAAVTALTFFVSGTKAAEQATIDFSDAIDANTGKLAANAPAVVAEKVKDAEKAYVAAGGAVGDYTSAVLGLAGPQARVMATFDSTLKKQITGTTEWGRYGTALGKIGITQSDVANAFVKGGDAVTALKGKISDNSGALQKMGIDSTNVIGGIDRIGEAAGGTAKQLGQYRSDVQGVVDVQTTGIAVAKNAAAAAAAVGTAVDGLPKGTAFDDLGRHAAAAKGAFETAGFAAQKIGEDAAAGAVTAQSAYDQFAANVKGINVSIDDKGVATFTTATEDAFAQYKKDAQDASDQADLFWFAAAGPAATAQQAVYAQAAAMRAVGAQLRDQQSNAADLEAKKQALQDAKDAKGKTHMVDTVVGGKVQTNEDGSAVQHSELVISDKDADIAIAAARRDLAAATAAATAEQADFFQASTDAAKSVLANVASTYVQTRATKDDTAARAAAVKVMAAGRAEFIKNYIAGAQASMSEKDRASTLASVTAAAGKAADAVHLIPSQTNTYIDADSSDLIAKAADAEAKTKELKKAKVVKFQADTKDALNIMSIYGGDLKKIPKSLKTTFSNDVKTAEENGKRLYKSYNATTGYWKAEFLTPNEATARIKAGGVVKQYDRAKGTWTATLTAVDKGASQAAINLQKQAQLATQLRTLKLLGEDQASQKVRDVLTQIALLKDKTVTLGVNASGVAGSMKINPDGSFTSGGRTGLANGGFVSGPGGPREDKVPAMLSNGEFVINAAATKKNLPLLHQINKYADGGLVTTGTVNMTGSGNIDAATGQINAVLANATKSADAFNAAAAAMATAGAQAASGLLGNNDPSSYGWAVGQNIVPYSFHGVAFPSGVAAGTPPLWNSLLSALEPTIPGGIRPGEDWGYENRDNVNSPGKKSMHAYGLALDVNSSENPNLPGTVGSRGNGQYMIPNSAQALARSHNMLWGGEWGDAMHFELHETPAQVNGAASAASAALGAAGSLTNLVTGSGVERWRPLAMKVAAAKGYPNASVDVMLRQMERESSGNPQAINLTDSNAQAGHPSKGLLQFIQTTFADNADPGFGTNIWDPESQMRAWYNYLAARYGGWEAYSHRTGDTYGAYANGGLVRGPGTGRSDSIPARVSNGEYIVNAKSTAANLPLLHSINGYANGGLVGSIKNLSGGAVSAAGAELSNVVQALQEIAQAVRDARDAVAGKRDTERTKYDSLLSARATASANIAAAEGRLKAAQKAATGSAAAQGAAAAAQLAGRANSSAAAVASAQKRLADAQAAPHTGQWGKAITTAENALKKAQASSASAQAALDARVHAVTASKAASAAAKIEAAQLQLTKVQSLAKVSVGNAERNYSAARKTADAYAASAAAAEAYQRSQQRVFRQQQSRAAQMDRLAVSLSSASDKLAGLRSDRSSMLSSLSGTVSGFDGGITGHSDTRTDFAKILKGQQYNAKQAQDFNLNISKLSKLGLSNDSLNSIASAGVDGGGATAAALAKATPAQIKQLNSVALQMHRIGDNVGNVVAGQFYDAGIQAGAGLVSGLKAQMGAIQKVMNDVANTLVNALTTKLQIHSPSKVMHGHGVNIVDGLSNGIMSGYGKVGSSMAGLVQVPNIPSQSFGRAGSSSPQITLHISGSDNLSAAVASMISVEFDGHLVDVGHAFEKAGMQS